MLCEQVVKNGPVVLIDANARLASVTSQHVRARNPEKQNKNGEAIHAWMTELKLAATNTMFGQEGRRRELQMEPSRGSVASRFTGRSGRMSRARVRGKR